MSTATRDPDVEKAREAALRMLDRARRTRRELERKLAEKSHSPEAITGALDRLARVGLVDDLEYARAFARATLARRPLALRLLRQKLRQKGIGEEDLERALADPGPGSENAIVGSAAEQARAARALAPLLRRYRALDPAQARTRCGAALARRGFDYETIARVITEAFRAAPEGSESA